MFRKPKRKQIESLRKKEDNDDGSRRGSADHLNDEEDEDDTTPTLHNTIQQNKREKMDNSNKSINKITSSHSTQQKDSIMHTFDRNKNDDNIVTSRNLVTSTAEHHPTSATNADNTDLIINRKDGIYRGDQVRNKFHAGPIRAPTNIRTTARFDYQPDICKDYKETGFCGYGDTCIYLHDRTDTISGWQLEQQWEQQQKLKREKQEQIMNNFASNGGNSNNLNRTETTTTTLIDDGIPYACYLCREHFKDPVVTNCSHYFCEKCIINHIRSNINDECPVCHKDTGSVFNCPNKLIAKKRKVLGKGNDKQDEESWVQYFHTFRSNGISKDNEETND